MDRLAYAAAPARVMGGFRYPGLCVFLSGHSHAYGRQANIAGMRPKEGDVVDVRERSRRMTVLLVS